MGGDNVAAGPAGYTVTVVGGDVVENLAFGAYHSPSPTNLIVNGGFETGNFSGWTVNTPVNPLAPWTVSAAGTNGTLTTISPPEGNYDAWNGFDGGGPIEFTMYQDVSIPACTVDTLTWKDRTQWNVNGQPRTLQVQVRDPATNAILSTVYSFSTTSTSGDTGWLSHGVNLSSYAGSNVRIYFVESIPENLTGPGQIEFDAISLTAGSSAGSHVVTLGAGQVVNAIDFDNLFSTGEADLLNVSNTGVSSINNISSAWDGNNAVANQQGDNSIAADKSVPPPGKLGESSDSGQKAYVNATDQTIARDNTTGRTNAQALITAPSVLTTEDTTTADDNTAVSSAVLRNDRNTQGGELNIYCVDATCSLGASLPIGSDQTIRYDPGVSAALRAFLAGQSVRDSLSYTIKDSNGLADTAAAKVSASGLDEPSGGEGMAVASGGSESTALPLLLATDGRRATNNTTAHDKAIGSGTLDDPLGYLSWLYDFDLLGNGQKSKKSNSRASAVDAVLSSSML